MQKLFRKIIKFSSLLSLSLMIVSCQEKTQEKKPPKSKLEQLNENEAEQKVIETDTTKELENKQINLENIFELADDNQDVGELFDNLKKEYEDSTSNTDFNQLRLYGWRKNRGKVNKNLVHLTLPKTGNNPNRTLLRFRKDIDLNKVPWKYSPKGHFVKSSFDQTTRTLILEYTLNNKTYTQVIKIPKSKVKRVKDITTTQKQNNFINNNQNTQDQDNISITTSQSKTNTIDKVQNTKLTEVKISTWNIQNFGNSKINKEDFRIKALAEIIYLEQLQFISIQEVNYEEFKGVETLVEVLNEKYQLNFKLAKSPLGLISNTRKNSPAVWESYAILYNSDIFTQLNTHDFNSYRGKDVTFTRPLWLSYWQIKNSLTKFWIINGHLDGPGANYKYNEVLSPTINGYKWSSQGDQEVKEFLDLHNAFESLKAFYNSQDLEDLVIFNGDTNIKDNHFIYANEYYLKRNYELGYQKPLAKSEIEYYKTSFSKNRYVNPYDKFIAYDPKDEFEALKSKDFKFNLLEVFKQKLNYQKYLELYTKQTNKPSLNEQELALKLSDHTFANALIKIKRP